MANGLNPGEFCDRPCDGSSAQDELLEEYYQDYDILASWSSYEVLVYSTTPESKQRKNLGRKKKIGLAKTGGEITRPEVGIQPARSLYVAQQMRFRLLNSVADAYSLQLVLPFKKIKTIAERPSPVTKPARSLQCQVTGSKE